MLIDQLFRDNGSKGFSHKGQVVKNAEPTCNILRFVTKRSPIRTGVVGESASTSALVAEAEAEDAGPEAEVTAEAEVE